jgi:hypothetical protein
MRQRGATNPKSAQQQSRIREEALEALAYDLELLNSYCQPPDFLERQFKIADPDHPKLPDLMKRFLWPPRELLQSLERGVMSLIESEREYPPLPAWKAFKLLDRRRRSLKLVLRINTLAKRAIDRLKEKGGESVLNKAAGNPDSLETQILLRQLVANRQKFADLLTDHDNRLKERLASMPLIGWLCEVGHPNVQELVLFGHAPASTAKLYSGIERELTTLSKRDANRKRQRRHGQRKNSLPEKRY